jgi:hypothetical protein
MKINWAAFLQVFYKFLMAVLTLLIGVNQVQIAYDHEALSKDIHAVQEVLSSHADKL